MLCVRILLFKICSIFRRKLRLLFGILVIVKLFGSKKLGSIVTSLVLLLILYFLQQQGIVSLDNSKASVTKLTPKVIIRPEVAGASESAALVRRVIDGDTIELETGQTVRYIGIDTPETKDPRTSIQCFGKEAYEANKQLVEGKKVRLEKDVSETDRYGRLLRYVYVTNSHPSPLSEREGNTEVLVNDYLVKEGFAQSSAYPPDISKQSLFDASESEARAMNKGLWATCN